MTSPPAPGRHGTPCRSGTTPRAHRRQHRVFLLAEAAAGSVHPFGHAADFIVSATFAHLLRVVGFGDLALVEETLAEDSGAHEVPMIEQLHELERENYAAFVPYS